MRSLANAGCATIAFGLETLSLSCQAPVDKRQSLPVPLKTLDAAERAGISIVINYVTGFPGTDAAEEARYFDILRCEFDARPSLHANIEHIQLERMSPMGGNPQALVYASPKPGRGFRAGLAARSCA